MKKEDLRIFLNQSVKLVLNNNFRLFGEIIKVTDDSIIFKTKERTSLIKFEFIREIVGW